MNAATTRAVEELAQAMDITPDEVVERAVRALAMLRWTLWFTAPVSARDMTNGEGE